MKILLKNHNGVLSELKPHFELTNSIQEADAVVLWQDTMGLELLTAKTAKRLRKPVVVIQHGRGVGEDYCPPLSNPFLFDKICVWSVSDKEQMIKCGIPENKIEITGTTIFKNLKGREPHDGINILYSPEHWDYDIEENIEVMDELKKICKKNNWNLTAKIIEKHEPENYKGYSVFTNRGQPDHLKIVCGLISKADVIVSLSEMTLELLAEASDVPVVCYTNIKQRKLNNNPAYLELYRTYSKAVKQVDNLDKLEETIKSQIKNPQELQKERADIALLEGGIDIKDPLQNMINVIYGTIK